jgi:hypothetical protein
MVNTEYVKLWVFTESRELLDEYFMQFVEAYGDTEGFGNENDEMSGELLDFSDLPRVCIQAVTDIDPRYIARGGVVMFFKFKEHNDFRFMPPVMDGVNEWSVNTIGGDNPGAYLSFSGRAKGFIVGLVDSDGEAYQDGIGSLLKF